MTTSLTRTSTFTMTDAMYVGSKLGADLRCLNSRYGTPISSLDEYVCETALLLKAGYLDTVDFGFKDGERWMLRLRYTATTGGQLRDDTPGGLPPSYSIVSYSFHSYLKYSRAFHLLSDADQEAFKRTLPVQRVGGKEPSALTGLYGNSSQYARNGVGLTRDVYCAV